MAIELFALFVANLTTIVARAPEFQESLLGTLQQGAAMIGIESTLTWETVRREVPGNFNLQGMIRTGFVSIAGLLGLKIAAQMLLGNIIEPQVMSNSLNLSPYVMLISLTAWSSLWGIGGAIFSVPIAAIMVIVFSEFEGTRPLALLLPLNAQIPERAD
ncbi:AI-2E family transporter [Rhodocyclaceae bacterium SMB388]